MPNQERKPFLQILKTAVDIMGGRKKGYIHPDLYDEFAYEFLQRGVVADDLATFIQEYLPSGSGILDLAAGTGAISLELAQRGYEVTALDITKEALTALRTKEEKIPQYNQIKIILADMNSPLGFSSNVFDAVTVNSAERYITNFSSWALEINRVLKPGGLFFWSTNLINRFQWLGSKDIPQWPHTPEKLLKGLQTQGFEAIEIQYRNLGLKPGINPQYIVVRK